MSTSKIYENDIEVIDYNGYVWNTSVITENGICMTCIV